MNSLRHLTPLLPLALLSGMAGSALGGWNEGQAESDEALLLTPDLNNGRDIYEVCAACHMLEGWGLPDGTYPQVAGQHRTVTIKQLADIRTHNRDNPSMYPFALPKEIGGPQAIADVAAYMEKLPMAPENGLGPGAGLDLGKRLFEENCVDCHGTSGEGNAEKAYPRIHGQHYRYLLRQFEWIHSGKRRNANREMAKQIANFTTEQMQAVMDYVSRIQPPKELLAPSMEWMNPDYD